MEHIIKFVEEQYPAGFNLSAMFTIFMVMIAFMVVTGGLGRLIKKGPNSGLSHSTSTACAILFIYTVFVLFYRIDRELLAFITDKLPLIHFDGDNVSIYRIEGRTFPELCSEFLHIYILSFLVIAVDDLIPDSKNVLSWFILQFVLCFCAIFAYCVGIHMLNSYVPGFLVSYAPMIIVCIVLAFIMLAVIRIICNLMMTVVDPLLGAVYDFMIGKKLGNCIYKAAMCSGLLMLLVWRLEALGHISVNVMDISLLGFLPLIALLMLFWYLLGAVI